MIVGVLRHAVFPVDDFIELVNGTVILVHPIVGVAQLIIVGIGPFPAFAVVLQ